MALNYTTYVAQLANLMVQTSSGPEFTTFLPGAIDYAEQRIYRELDLTATSVIDNTGTFPVQNRIFTLPASTGTFIIVEEISAITPAGASVANGTRNPLLFTSKEFIDACYPSQLSNNNIPRFAYLLSENQVMVGPAADAAYAAEVIGTQRPAPLSVTNSSTFLTRVLPDLFMAASMVFGSAYMRDFGQTADNPQMGTSWEGQYKTLKESANLEELRKQYKSVGWSAEPPSQISTPPRT